MMPTMPMASFCTLAPDRAPHLGPVIGTQNHRSGTRAPCSGLSVRKHPPGSVTFAGRIPATPGSGRAIALRGRSRRMTFAIACMRYAKGQKQEHEKSCSTVRGCHFGWRPKLGLLLLILALVSPVLSILVLTTDLPRDRGAVAGLLLFGVPMALMMAIVALFGQPAYAYIRSPRCGQGSSAGGGGCEALPHRPLAAGDLVPDELARAAAFAAYAGAGSQEDSDRHGGRWHGAGQPLRARRGVLGQGACPVRP